MQVSHTDTAAVGRESVPAGTGSHTHSKPLLLLFALNISMDVLVMCHNTALVLGKDRLSDPVVHLFACCAYPSAEESLCR